MDGSRLRRALRRLRRLRHDPPHPSGHQQLRRVLQEQAGQEGRPDKEGKEARGEEEGAKVPGEI